MYVADQAISLVFDGKFKEMSIKDIVQMVGMIIGLRMANKINPLTSISQALHEYTIRDVSRNPS